MLVRKLGITTEARCGSFGCRVDTYSSQLSVGSVHGEPDFLRVFSAQIDPFRAAGCGAIFRQFVPSTDTDNRDDDASAQPSRPL
jgi:hypothetical protein